jgi:transcriptional regulator with PAS, ATPase and Fis domain
LIAKVIHNNSKRKYGRLMLVDCRNPNVNALEIELFGQEKNKTNYGRMQMIGKLEQANGGSIILHEVGSIPNIIQARLLKVIEDQEIYRVGGTNVVPVDVHIIATTSEELEHAIKAGSFREDLFYRMAVFPIFIHPLRTSRNDIRILAYHFLRTTTNRTNKTITSISDDAMKLIMDYDFPGNIRELKEVIEYATNIEESDKLRSESLPKYIRSGHKVKATFQSGDLKDKIITLEETEKQALINAIKITGNNIQMMAKALGINRTTVYRKLEKYNLLAKQ